MKEELKVFTDIATALLDDEQVCPVVKPINPNDLFNSLDLNLESEGISSEAFQAILKKLVLASPRTTTKRFFNQLFGGRNNISTLGDLIAVLLNNVMHTYKVSGPMVGVEKVMIEKICSLVGYSDNSGGAMAPGGSMTNLMGIIMGRDHYNKDIRVTGVKKTMVAYTSRESHYSISKNASFVGIGRENVRHVDSDDKGIMIPEALEKQINLDLERGYAPFFVNATAGTTVLGAFDPLEAIGKIAKKYNLWFHVDGAYCGSVIFSDKYKHLVNGSSLADSFTFNGHKMLGTPATCSFIVVKNKQHLYSSFSNDATYLYQMNSDDYNLGKTSLQCGRRNDGLKMWALWKSVGHSGLAEIIDQQFYLAEIARKYISDNEDYTLYSHPDSISVCFNYKNYDPSILTSELYKAGHLMVGHGTFRSDTFIRLVTINYGNTETEILEFFEILESFAESLS